MIDKPDDLWNVAAVVNYTDGSKRTYFGMVKEELEWLVHMDGDHVRSWDMIAKEDYYK